MIFLPKLYNGLAITILTTQARQQLEIENLSNKLNDLFVYTINAEILEYLSFTLIVYYDNLYCHIQ